MKTLFANNGSNNFAALKFDVLTSEELASVKGGLGPITKDIDWEDKFNNPKVAAMFAK